MCLSTPSIPKMPAPPPPVSSPQEVADSVKEARGTERKRLAAMKGRASTRKTNPLDDSEPVTRKKTLLGG